MAAIRTASWSLHTKFDPQSGAWSAATPLPTARDHLVVIAAGGKIHVIGGRFKGPADRTGEHDVYDPATNTWSSAAPLPTPRSGLASANYHALILVLGGELPPDHTFPENERYDLKTDRWMRLAPMPHGRHGFGGDVVGDNAYFVGGSLTPGDGGATNQLLCFICLKEKSRSSMESTDILQNSNFLIADGSVGSRVAVTTTLASRPVYPK